MKAFFADDFLTATLAAGLLLDIPQQLIPLDWKILLPFDFVPSSDRAEYLERSFTEAWSGVLSQQRSGSHPKLENFFSKGVYGYWKADGTLPILAFNTTIIETGQPLIISPIYISRSTGAMAPFFHSYDIDQSLNVSVAHAAGLSSRFPFITPPGEITNERSQANRLPGFIRLADGGYYENSGARTAIEIGLAIDRSIKTGGDLARFRGKIELHYLVFIHDTSPNYAQWYYPEIMTPLRGLMGAREQRGYEYVDVLEAMGANIRIISLVDGDFRPPLAWVLSRATRLKIDQRSGFGDAKGCSIQSGKGQPEVCLIVRRVAEYLEGTRSD